ncbi:MAG: 3-hydroxyacyl-CoA dehydrogenase [Acidibacillus sp.]|nr:3-hydroxyacyl-CoA dehydrogenase [Acidibacillus sp.]
MDIALKTFLITGGGSGLGAATATLFRQAHAHIVIADVHETLGQQVADDIGATFVHTDVTSEESVKHAVEVAMQRYGAIHGVVNCAGLGISSKVIGKQGPHALSQFQKVVEVNLIGTFNVIRLVTEGMLQSEADVEGRRGVLINTASIAAFDGQIGQAAYAASKGGIVGMTLPIARELAQYGIRVMSIAPGIFDTPMLGQLSDDVRRSLGSQVPFPKRLGQPQEFAMLARHIVENDMMNGEVIRLDGAIRMAPR